MNRRMTSALLAAFVALALAAAPASTQTVMAVRAGASIATLDYESDPGPDIGYRRGIAVGVSVTRYLGEKVGVRLGGAFASKGATASFEGGAASTLRISYVELSPLIDIRPIHKTGDREASFDLLVGPTVSFKRSCDNAPPDGAAPILCEDLNLDIASVDVGATVGTGFHLQILRDPSVALSVEAFYTHGFREVDNLNNMNPGKSRAFSFRAGLGFPIG